jgi:hypothetical protein
MELSSALVKEIRGGELKISKVLINKAQKIICYYNLDYKKEVSAK